MEASPPGKANSNSGQPRPRKAHPVEGFGQMPPPTSDRQGVGPAEHGGLTLVDVDNTVITLDDEVFPETTAFQRLV